MGGRDPEGSVGTPSLAITGVSSSGYPDPSRVTDSSVISDPTVEIVVPGGLIVRVLVGADALRPEERACGDRADPVRRHPRSWCAASGGRSSHHPEPAA